VFSEIKKKVPTAWGVQDEAISLDNGTEKSERGRAPAGSIGGYLRKKEATCWYDSTGSVSMTTPRGNVKTGTAHPRRAESGTRSWGQVSLIKTHWEKLPIRSEPSDAQVRKYSGSCGEGSKPLETIGKKGQKKAVQEQKKQQGQQPSKVV